MRCTEGITLRRRRRRRSRKIKRGDGISIAIKYLVTGKQMEEKKNIVVVGANGSISKAIIPLLLKNY